MLLIFDIGNTNVKVALFESDKLLQHWRLNTDQNCTGDEYFTLINTLFKDYNLDVKQITDVVISSVVPQLIRAFVIVTQRLLNKKPLIIGPDMYHKLPVSIPPTAVYEIGTDLLCDAVQAWETYHQACIVVDFGTALSFVAVGNNANILGIAIAPGIGTAFKSLFSNTAQLPSVPLEIPSSSLGINTTMSIQSGIMFGYKGLIEGIINQMKADMQKQENIKPESIITIATGGLSSVLMPITTIFDKIDKQHTLNGLYTIAKYALK
ncbi:MAG TPA: type III pantothenate kinase [Bacteroidales bacterium]|jgi:type III pantothenate kinase|nr:type III pantothenate kinase [Bacteroidales bacterium]